MARDRSRLSRRKADLHEALHMRLVPLLRLVERMALRRPEGLVSSKIRSLAEAALFDARGFRSLAGGERFPNADPHYAPLAGQLGAALADLDAFETKYSRWDHEIRAQVWLVDGTMLPVRRLRPRLAGGQQSVDPTKAATAAREEAQLEDMRRKVSIRIAQYYNRTENRPLAPKSLDFAEAYLQSDAEKC